MCQTVSISKPEGTAITTDIHGHNIRSAVFADGDMAFGISGAVKDLTNGEVIEGRPRERTIVGSVDFFDSLYSFMKFNEQNYPLEEEQRFDYRGIDIIYRDKSEGYLNWQIINPNDSERGRYRLNFGIEKLEEALDHARYNLD